MDHEAPIVLEVRDLRRAYGRFRRVEAVRGVSFSVRRGEVFGLIGPDGAGKTSIIQALAGVLRPHGGTAAVEGLDVVRAGERVRQRVGYMPQGLGSNLYDSLTVRENIEFFRELRRLPEEVYRRNLADLLAVTRLEPFLERRAGHLSGGMRQKLALICTLIHLPDVLLLDEPTTGVDPISRQDFWHIMRRIVDERHATVLVTTSYMDEAERCHRIALLHAGRIVAEGTPDAIRGRADGHFARLVGTPQTVAVDCLRHRPDVRATNVFGDEIHIEFVGALRDIEQALTSGGVDVVEMAAQDARLEDVFLQLIPEDGPGAGVVELPPAAAAPNDVSVSCRGVSRRFDGVAAVDGVELSIRRGEIFGLLGPNGAGKTTLIKMLCGLLDASDGEIAVGGIDVRTGRARVRTTIGYMSQRFSLYQDLTVAQNVQLYADLYGLDRDAPADLIARLGLEPFTRRLTRDLPVGVRQRVSLLCAVVHRPAIVFLDEPTSGVDPRARRVFWELIYTLSRRAGITVLVSTHYMDEAAHCDRLGLMHQGRLIATGSPARLKAQSEHRSGSLLAIRSSDTRATYDALRRMHRDALVFGDEIRIRSFEPDAEHERLASQLARQGIERVRIEQVPLSMDDAFIDFIEADRD